MYYGFIAVFAFILGVIDSFIIEESVLYVAIAIIINIVVVVIVDAITATIVRWALPKKWFSFDREFYAGNRKECKFYELIGIKKWKDKIPEFGKVTDFRKNKISDPKNNEYVKRYILEANYGVMVHITGIIFGFAIIFIYPLKYCLFFGIPIAIVNGVYNALSLFILRYNLPKLHQLFRINEKRKEREIRNSASA